MYLFPFGRAKRRLVQTLVLGGELAEDLEWIMVETYSI